MGGTNKKGFPTYCPALTVAGQFKQAGAFDPQRGVHQHVQVGELAL